VYNATKVRVSPPMAANAIFSRVGRAASEEVVLHLMLTKCIAYQSCYMVLKLAL